MPQAPLDLVRANLSRCAPPPLPGHTRLSVDAEPLGDRIIVRVIDRSSLPIGVVDPKNFWAFGGQVTEDLNVIPSYYAVDRDSDSVVWYFEVDCLPDSVEAP